VSKVLFILLPAVVAVTATMLSGCGDWYAWPASARPAAGPAQTHSENPAHESPQHASASASGGHSGHDETAFIRSSDEQASAGATAICPMTGKPMHAMGHGDGSSSAAARASSGCPRCQSPMQTAPGSVERDDST